MPAIEPLVRKYEEAGRNTGLFLYSSRSTWVDDIAQNSPRAPRSSLPVSGSFRARARHKEGDRELRISESGHTTFPAVPCSQLSEPLFRNTLAALVCLCGAGGCLLTRKWVPARALRLPSRSCEELLVAQLPVPRSQSSYFPVSTPPSQVCANQPISRRHHVLPLRLPPLMPTFVPIVLSFAAPVRLRPDTRHIPLTHQPQACRIDKQM